MKYRYRINEQCEERRESLEWILKELKTRSAGSDADRKKACSASDTIACTDSCKDGLTWVQLQRAVQNLPRELILLIRDLMHKEVFGPGKEIVFPIRESSSVRHFRALDRQLYKKYHYVYYCQNMWTIEDGPGEWIVYCTDYLMPYPFSQIRELTLKWTRKDYYWEGLEVENFIDWRMEEGGAGGLDTLRAVNDFSGVCDEVAIKLEKTWFKKLDAVTRMTLDCLIIDARDAYAPDGEYLGLIIAEKHEWSSSVKIPDRVSVLAPDPDMAAQIRQAVFR